MELPRGAEGRKATHDFLSLYSSSSSHAQLDPGPPQGSYLKTHDFLRPLERDGKRAAAKEEKTGAMVALDKPPAPGPPFLVEHLLPGGIGTYSISYFNERASKPEKSSFTSVQDKSTTRNDQNSNHSSYTGSVFTLWDKSAVKRGKTGKENVAAGRQFMPETGVNVVGGQWTSLLNKPCHSSSSHKQNSATFSSFSSSQPSSSQNNQSFMDMITSAKNEKEEDDDDEDDKFIIKKELSSHPKVEGKTMDQKPCTPRSKHSATEQRRRSKINDRFQKLREIIPNSDQKRDKASFLLEVIDYIQFLHEKLSRYESSCKPWSHEASKTMEGGNFRIGEGFIDHARGEKTEFSPASLVAAKFDENKVGGVSSSIPTNGQNLIDSDINTSATFKELVQRPELTSKPVSLHPTIQPYIFSFGRTSTTALSPISPNPTSQKKSYSDNHTCAGSQTKDQEMNIESGTINISSIYSQGLLNTLTQALHSTGVDMSQACVSVQIDLGKRAYSASHSKEDGNILAGEDLEHASKKLRSS